MLFSPPFFGRDFFKKKFFISKAFKVLALSFANYYILLFFPKSIAYYHYI